MLLRFMMLPPTGWRAHRRLATCLQCTAACCHRDLIQSHCAHMPHTPANHVIHMPHTPANHISLMPHAAANHITHTPYTAANHITHTPHTSINHIAHMLHTATSHATHTCDTHLTIAFPHYACACTHHIHTSRASHLICCVATGY